MRRIRAWWWRRVGHTMFCPWCGRPIHPDLIYKPGLYVDCPKCETVTELRSVS